MAIKKTIVQQFVDFNEPEVCIKSSKNLDYIIVENNYSERLNKNAGVVTQSIKISKRSLAIFASELMKIEDRKPIKNK